MPAVTSQGSPYSRFQRALKTGNPHIVHAAARELPYISLKDAASICAVYAETRDDRLRPAAIRWIYRLCTEHPAVSLEDVTAAAAAFETMPTRRQDAVQALQTIAARAGT
ncbi:MAG: hypothetical protein JWM31_25 [Solirubrobacterales bacterium]|nr:hypothetical protein [Solirubrobacterales bacterium]